MYVTTHASKMEIYRLVPEELYLKIQATQQDLETTHQSKESSLKLVSIFRKKHQVKIRRHLLQLWDFGVRWSDEGIFTTPKKLLNKDIVPILNFAFSGSSQPKSWINYCEFLIDNGVEITGFSDRARATHKQVLKKKQQDAKIGRKLR